MRSKGGRNGSPSFFWDWSEDIVRKVELRLEVVTEGLNLRASAGAKIVLAESLIK